MLLPLVELRLLYRIDALPPHLLFQELNGDTMIAQGYAVPEPDIIQAPFFFFSNNETSHILYVSPSIEDVLGYKPEQVIGQKYTEFISGSDQLNADIPECRQRRFGGDSIHQNLRAVRSLDGELKVLRVQTCSRMNEEGEIIANHGIAVDVTRAYLKEQQMLARYKQLCIYYSLLSQREQAVLSFVAEGKPNKSIAKRLEISERGVENIRSRLYKKFEVNSSAELVSKAKEYEVLADVMQFSQFGTLAV